MRWDLLDGMTARLGCAIDKRAASSVLAVSEMHQELCENQQQGHKRCKFRAPSMVIATPLYP